MAQRKKRADGKPSQQYFTSDTDRHIVLFNQSTDISEKHRVFEEGIQPAFEKLIENLIYVYGYYVIDDTDTLKKECLAVLYEMLPKYNSDLGTKGFSYFNVVAKNWFIHKIREKNKRSNLLIDDLIPSDALGDNHGRGIGWQREHGYNVHPNFVEDSHEELLEEKERWLELYGEMEVWKAYLAKKTEQQVLEAVIFIVRNPDLVTIYNRKAVYLYIREMTGLTSKQVVVNLKKIRELYEKWCGSFFGGKETDYEA